MYTNGMQKVGKLPLVTSFDAYSYQGSHREHMSEVVLKQKRCQHYDSHMLLSAEFPAKRNHLSES